MIKSGKFGLALLCLALVSGCGDDATSTAGEGAMPTVGSSSDVTAFQGAKAGQAEGGLRELGYAPAKTQGLTTWWSNSETGACAKIVTSDGRYSSVTMVPAAEC